jgi:DNA transformation protein
MKKPPLKIPELESDFPAFVLEQLEAMSGLESRPMFGGQGLYSAGVFFGIIWQGRLYLKTNEHTAPQYLEAGSAYFHASPKQELRQFYEVPAHILERNAELVRWALQAAAI